MASLCLAEPKSELEIRFLAERLPNNLGKVVLVNAETRSEPFDLPMNNLSKPQAPPARLFSVWSLEKDVSLATVKLPEEGNAFVVLLIPTAEGLYSPIVMPFDNPNFRSGDIYFHNNTNKPVLGVLGKTKFSLLPGNSTIITPRGFGNKKYYHAMLGVQDGEKTQVIRSMKWPSSKTMRNYIFFYIDPKNNRITYRGVDEFLLPDED